MTTNNPNFYYPTDSGAEDLQLRVKTGPFDPEEEWRECVRVREEAFMDGVPGLGAVGAMTPRQAQAHATRMQSVDLLIKPSWKPTESPEHLRSVMVYHDADGESRLVGLATYGRSTTEWGTHWRDQGENPAHMNAFNIAPRTGEQSLEPAKRRAIGALMLHRVAIDAMMPSSSPDGTPYTQLHYNAARQNRSWIIDEAGRLGLEDHLKEDRKKTPGADFATRVQNEAAMERGLLSLPLEPLAAALVRRYTWLEPHTT